MRSIFALEPGDGPMATRLAAVGLLSALATSIGETVTQAVLVAEAGAGALPRAVFAKAVLDVVVLALALAVIRRRRPGRAMAGVLVAHGLVLAATAAAMGHARGVWGFVPFVVHEASWTAITVEFGVWAVAGDAARAARLVPLGFAAQLVGRAIAGATVGGLASHGPARALAVGAGLALAAAAAAFGTPGEAPEAPPVWQGIRRALGSPLVRAIAASTAIMVLVREALRATSLALAAAATDGTAPALQAFWGRYGMIANAAALVLAVFVTPRLIRALGLAPLNLGYALATTASAALALVAPGAAAAMAQRFTQAELKDAIKTPLSALFYAGEPAEGRAPARAVVFAIAIPCATAATSGLLAIAGPRGMPWLAAGAAATFVVASAVQNRVYASVTAK